MHSLISRAVVVLIDELRGNIPHRALPTGLISMQELVLMSDLGSKLTVKAESSIDDHFVLQINDIGYHLPREAANGLIALLKKISMAGSDVKK
jgi:hypothetical protein